MANNRYIIILLTGSLLFIAGCGSSVSTPRSSQPRMHAHNDYYHTNPLHDALDNGFTSVEADIFLVNGELLVGHSKKELKPQNTLEALYLKPLEQRIRADRGRHYGKDRPILLLIDIKDNGAETYRVLDRLLSGYDGIITAWIDGQVNARAVRAIISGDRAFGEIIADSSRYAGIDGRLTDLDSQLDASVIPLISDSWSSHFRWRGEGAITDEELTKLRDIVRQTHAKGRMLRFYGTPNTPLVHRDNLWRLLLDEQVDLIGADDLEALAAFITAN